MQMRWVHFKLVQHPKKKALRQADVGYFNYWIKEMHVEVKEGTPLPTPYTLQKTLSRRF